MFEPALLLTAVISAHCPIVTLTASEGEPFDEFGQAVAVSGDVIVVGAWQEDGEAGPDVGAAYVFRRRGEGWIQEARLTPPAPGALDRFGNAVAVEGSIVVIGAAEDDHHGLEDAGSIYVYRYDGVWSLEAELQADAPRTDGDFGWSVDVDAGRIAVGTPGTSSSGAVHVFSGAPDWAQRSVLSASDGSHADFFGRAIDLDGDAIVVGAPYHDQPFVDAGAAYVYRHAGGRWTEEAKLVSPAPAYLHLFGRRVALDGDLLLVNVLYAFQPFRFDGAAWTLEPRIESRTGLGYYAAAVALEGSMLVTGHAFAGGCCGRRTGISTLFVEDGGSWIEAASHCPPDGAPEQRYGNAVAFDEGTMVVGWSKSDHQGIDSGSVLVLDDPGCSLPADCTAQWHGDLASWSAAVGDFGTLHFTEAQGVLTDQYEDLGVLFTGTEIVQGPTCNHATDLWGAHGGSNDNIHFLFVDGPMQWLAADFTGTIQLFFYREGELVYEAPVFAEGGTRHFGGIVLAEPFDEVVILDPCDSAVLVDDIHFGPAPRTQAPEITDCDGSGFFDACDEVNPCPGNSNPDCHVGVDDLVGVILAWGTFHPVFDIDGDNVVGVQDLVMVIANWGDCP